MLQQARNERAAAQLREEVTLFERYVYLERDVRRLGVQINRMRRDCTCGAGEVE